MKKQYSYQDMKRDLRKLSKEYTGIVRVFSLAETPDKNRIYGIRLGNPLAEKHIVVQAAMHAREWLNTELLMSMVKRCCYHYDTGSYQGVTYQKLFNRVCFWILPMVNPDGVAISQYGVSALHSVQLQKLVKEMAGKYSKSWKANARGVDLNRNYSPGFGRDTAQERGGASYAGTCPFSERETRALVKLILKVKPVAVVNYHETGHLIYYKEEDELVQTVHSLTGYSLCREEGESNGNLGDWLTEQEISWCTVETCRGKAPVSRFQLLAEWSRHRELLPAIARIYQ